MGQDLANAYPSARAVFEEVDDALGEALSALIFEGSLETLTLTRNAQPALMAASMAAMRALEAEGVAITDADFVAGHSLGEYSALAASGALGIADCARLLRVRGDAMQQAVPQGVGAMAAILGLDAATVAQISEDAAQGEVCQLANENDPAQNVISGHVAAVERAAVLAKAAGAKRALMLPVSAPFHCALMQPAAELMRGALAEVAMQTPAVPLVANVTALPVTDPDTIRSQLVEQVAGRVRWASSVEWMVAQGVTSFVEIGAGKALSGMIRRIAKEVGTANVGTAAEAVAAAAAIKGEA
jgi:[acyl-carrier-protein] S-malonyltransferase